MKRVINPTDIAPPASAYHHAVLTRPVESLLTLSGQLGEAPDGSCLPDASSQARQAWSNVRSILSETGMALDDVVKVTSYIVGQENIAAYVAAHKEVLGGRLPPWTLVVVAALGRPEYLVEIDVTAAR
jgi:2-iminobutanoate/2-iminopropanoate deaminase